MESKLRTIASIATMGVMTLFAFNQKSKLEIRQRAGFKSEISGRSDLPMECIHVDHTQGTKHYNNPSNGFLGTVVEHLAHHVIYREFPREIGLSYHENEWAINAISHRCKEAYQNNPHQLAEDYQTALTQVNDYLSAKKEP